MIILAAVLALIVLISIIPIRIYADYHGAIKLWGRVLFWKIDIYPKNNKSGKKSKNEPVTHSSNSGRIDKRPKTASSKITENFSYSKESSQKKDVKGEPEKSPDNKFQEKETANHNEETLPEKIVRYLKLADDFLGPLRKSLRHLIKIENISADVTVGTNDAADTAIYAGMLWALGYNIIGLTNKIFKIEKHKLQIVPSYDKSVLKAEGSCILRSNIANIICAAAILGIAFLRYKLKNRRNKNERASIKRSDRNGAYQH